MNTPPALSPGMAAVLGLLAAVVAILLFLFLAGVRQPVMAKLGMRSIPRRPTQSILIVLGLTLSTIIIVSALAIGDTLRYSVRWHAIKSYGEIDEIIAPPLLGIVAQLAGGDSTSAAQESGEPAGATTWSALGDAGLSNVLQLLDQGLPGIDYARYEQLRDRVQQEPLADGIAASIVFPTIIRNTTTGQGEPLGFIMAVDDEYTRGFGLHSVDGQTVTMERLRPGVGNVFVLASRLFALASQAGSQLGLGSLKPSDVAVAIAGAGALLSGASGTDQPASAISTTLSLLGSTVPMSGTSPLTGTLSLANLNLNTLSSEVDRILGQVGLQLREGEVYLSQLGAERLDARPGDRLEIFLGPIPLPYRVVGIVDEAGPLSTLSPVVMMRLDEAQQLLFMQGRINNVLVSNRGDAAGGLQYSAAMTERLRVLALDDGVAEQIIGYLRTPGVRPIFEDAVAKRIALGGLARLTGGTQVVTPTGGIASALLGSLIPPGTLPQRLTDLRAGLDEAGGSKARDVLADAEVRAWLRQLPVPEFGRAEWQGWLDKVSPMEVIEPLNKATVVLVSGVAGTVFSSIFTIFGIFSILAGVLLIFLIFVMLAAERRSEMGVARAIGVQRRHLVQTFVTEGMLYDVVAAALGLALGLLVSFGMVGFIGGLFNTASGTVIGRPANIFEFRFAATTTSLIIGYCLGVLLTFLVVLVSSWRVSRLNIVTAIRDLPDEAQARTLSGRQRTWRWAVGLLWLAAAALLYLFSGRSDYTVALICATLALTGLTTLLARGLERGPMRPERVAWARYTLLGLGLIAIWGVPWRDLLRPAGVPSGVSLLQGNLTYLLSFVLSPTLLILGMIVLIMFNADAIAWIATHLFGGIGWLAPVLRTAIAYPLSARFRTGVAMVMFAMVVCTVTVMAVVIEATQSLIVLDVKHSAGFQIRTQSTLLSFFDPITNLQGRIAAQLQAHPLLEKITAVGGVAYQEVEARTPGMGTWGSASLVGLDAGYVAQAQKVYPMRARAQGFADDAAVWEALRTRDDVAIIAPNLLTRRQPVAVGGDESAGGAPPANGQSPWLTPYAPEPITIQEDRLPEVFMEVRPSADISTTHRLQVIGLLAENTTLAGESIQVPMAALRRIEGKEVMPQSFYLQVAPDADVHAVSQEVERTFLGSGLDATVMAESFALGQTVTRGILRLLQGFMALGLLVGIAALGVIASRTVVERRQQVGVLRALGFHPGMVAFCFLLESSFIALTGILIGAIAGLLLGDDMVRSFFAQFTPETHLVVPWAQLGVIALLAYSFSLLLTLVPALQASRIYPAEALRYE
jgi:putative ABC transport system permease protein